MYYQTEDYFNDNIKQYGCNFFSCLKIAELESPKNRFRKQDIEELYNICVDNRYMTKDCVVRFPDDVISAGYRYLTNTEIEAYQVGAIVDGETTYWKWVMKYKKYQAYKYMIYRWETYTGGEHFNLYDKDGNKLYDSWPEDVEKRVKQKILYYVNKQ